MASNDFGDDIEIGRPLAALQICDFPLDCTSIIYVGARELGAVGRNRRIGAKRGSAPLHIAPDENDRFAAFDRAEAAIKQIVEGIEALTEPPVGIP